MKVHFIAIGGSAMHNLAIALHLRGDEVSGSDDEIFDPARSRLEKYGLLPAKMGWDEGRIKSDLDAVIVGMHARADNPELKSAQLLGLAVHSYPSFLYDLSKNKIRIVIGGSHGKTTITAMVLHAMRDSGISTDFMLGAQLDGFEVMVGLSDDAPYMLMEGDEYLSAPNDSRPKFVLYRPHIGLISGIAWDHINVFKTFEDYLDQFRQFIAAFESGGELVYYAGDPRVKKLCESDLAAHLKGIPYDLPRARVDDGITTVLFDDKEYQLKIFGRHNLLNLQGAMKVCQQLGIPNDVFLKSMESFSGASKRLEPVLDEDDIKIFRDFAHAPSKVKATVEAVREQFPGKHLVACLELHTYSSLNTEFLPQYAGSLDMADTALVFFSRHALAIKRRPPLDPSDVRKGFHLPSLKVVEDIQSLENELAQCPKNNVCFLMMSSGNFEGLDIHDLGGRDR